MGKIRSTIDNIDKIGQPKVEETEDIIQDKRRQRIGADESELTGTNVLKGATPVLPVDQLGITEPVEQQKDEEGLGVSGREKLIERVKEGSPARGTQDKTKLAMPGPFLPFADATAPVDNEKARAQLTESERQGQTEFTPAPYLDDDFYNFTDATTLRSKFKNKRTVPEETVNAVIATGLQINSILPNLEKQLETDNTPDTMSLKNYMVEKGMLNQPNREIGAPLKFNRRFANALSMEVLGLIQDQVNRKQVSFAKGKEEALIDDADMATFFAGQDIDLPEAGIPQGEKLDANYLRGRIGVNILNSLVENPNKVGKYYSDYGGAGDQLVNTNPKVAALFDGMAFGIINDLGFFDPVYDEETGEYYYGISEDGVRYFNTSRDILWATGMRTKEDVSMIPTRITEGEKIPFTYTPKDKGPVTVKSEMAKTQRIQRKTKAHLGGVEFAIQDNATTYVKSVIEYIIGPVQMKNERPVVDMLMHPPKRTVSPQELEAIKQGAIEQAQGNVALRGKSQEEINKYIADITALATKQAGVDRSKFYSTDPLAEVLDLHEAKWNEHFNHAIKNPGASENPQTAINHANTQMKLKARQLYETGMDADRLKGKVFYMKPFNALANGRFHFRNSVMNPQNDKMARNIMGNARRVVIDFKQPLSSKQKEIMEGWKLVIGKNLLPVEMTNGVSTSNLGPNSIIDATNRVINRATPEARSTYDNWLKIGKELRALSANKRINIVALNALMAKSKEDLLGYAALEQLRSREDWNYIFQSYIDFANWHDASNTEETGPQLIQQGKILSIDEENQLATLQDEYNEATIAGDEIRASELEVQMMELSKDVVWTETVPKATTFSPRAQAQFDGKQNGIAIQAFQNGDINLMKRTGLIFASEDNIIPQGDIRKLFGDNTQAAIEGYVFKGGSSRIDHKRSFWLEIFDEYKGSEDAVGVFKELSKQPLMETSYGKYHMFHRETAENFYNGKYGEVIKDRLKGYSNMLPDYTDNEIIDDLNEIIGSTLSLTLDLKHQKVLKNVGKLFSMVGITPRFKGPLGETIFMGSKEYFESNKSIEIPTSRGLVRRNLGSMKPSGSSRSKRQRVYDNQTNEWRTADPTPFGQEVSNQIPVLLIQNIDSGIMATAINRVNDKRRPQEGSAYMIPVHDAIIVDATSVKEYLEAINKAFTDINMQYKTAKVILDAINEAKLIFRDKVKDNSIYELSLENRKYRAMQNYIDDVFKRAKERKDLAQNVSDRDMILMNRAVENGFKPEGSKVTGLQLKKLFFSINDHMGLSPMLNEWLKNSNAFTKEAYQDLLRKPETLADGTRVLRFITRNYS